MKKFFVLYMAPVAGMEKMMATATHEEMKTGVDAWTAWMEDHKADLAEVGAPLGKNKRVTKSSISDIKNEVTGYSIVLAETHEEAAALLQDSPHFGIPGAYIEVLDMVSIPGM